MIRYMIILFFFVTGCLFASETIIMKNNDTYSANLVYLDESVVIFLIKGNRFEFKRDEVSKVDFSKSENEFKIILNDGSSMIGSIIDQNDDFLTIGSNAGITPIEGKIIKQIINPLLEKSIKKSIGTLEFHYGNIPFTTFILNDFSKSYQAYWSYENYIETNFFLNAFLGLNAKIMVLMPQFNIYNDFIFIIPIHFTLNYQDNFYKHDTVNHWSRKLFWNIKGGIGLAIISLYESKENISTTSIGISSEVEYGIKYYLTKLVGIGIIGKTGIIAQENAMLITQSAGLVVELKF